MVMNWTPDKDQLMFLIYLKTHTAKIDFKAIADAWPDDQGDRPTPRAISERLVRMRKQVNGGAARSAASTPSKPKGAAKATPGKKTPASKKRKANDSADEDDEEPAVPKRELLDLLDGSPTPRIPARKTAPGRVDGSVFNPNGMGSSSGGTGSVNAMANGNANGHGNGTANGHTIGTANGHTIGTANGHTIGTANGHTIGTANGHTNGRTNGTTTSNTIAPPLPRSALIHTSTIAARTPNSAEFMTPAAVAISHPLGRPSTSASPAASRTTPRRAASAGIAAVIKEEQHGDNYGDDGFSDDDDAINDDDDDDSAASEWLGDLDLEV